MEQALAFSFSRVTLPEQRRLAPKQAGELSAANGEGPAWGVAEQGTRRSLAGKEVGRPFLLTLLGRNKRV